MFACQTLSWQPEEREKRVRSIPPRLSVSFASEINIPSLSSVLYFARVLFKLFSSTSECFCLFCLSSYILFSHTQLSFVHNALTFLRKLAFFGTTTTLQLFFIFLPKAINSFLYFKNIAAILTLLTQK